MLRTAFIFRSNTPWRTDVFVRSSTREFLNSKWFKILQISILNRANKIYVISARIWKQICTGFGNVQKKN